MNQKWTKSGLKLNQNWTKIEPTMDENNDIIIIVEIIRNIINTLLCLYIAKTHKFKSLCVFIFIKKVEERRMHMQYIYKVYRCQRCHKDIILLTEDIEDNKRKGKYIGCAFCGSREISEYKNVNDLRETREDHHVYRRVHGAIRQVR